MRTIQSAPPRAELSEFVRTYAEREIPANESPFFQANIATLEQGIAFYLGGQTFFDEANGSSRLAPMVNMFGAITLPGSGAHFSGNVLGFAIFFKPLASWQLFRTPPRVIANSGFAAEDVLGKRMEDVWCRMAEAKTFRQRVVVAEEFLLPFALNARGPTSIMRGARRIVQLQGTIRIEQLADLSGFSLRTFERQFAEEMGVNPKLFARITRFQRALDAKRLSPRSSWLNIAHQSGYFDQMHMIRDFQSLGGSAPGRLLERSGDLQPWSILPSVTAGPTILSVPR